MAGEQSLGPAHEYLRDAWQRSVLFLDVLRQRGNIYREQQAKVAPHVLDFDVELILDGRKLPTAGELPSGAHRAARRDGDRIRQSGRSSSSIPAPAMARASAA